MKTLIQPQLIGNCEKCPLTPDRPVNGYGPRNAKIAIVGESPSGYETRMGRPFVGPTGRLIRLVLQGFGIDDEKDVYWTNSIMCRGDEVKNTSIRSINACHDRLMQEELPMVMPQKILCLGGQALTSVMRSKKMLAITKMRGQGMMTTIAGRETFVVPTYHPMLIMAKQDLFRDLVTDIHKLLTFDAPLPDIKIANEIPFSPEEALEVLQSYAEAGTISCDLETTGLDYRTDKIISIGFGARDADENYHTAIIHSLAYKDARVRDLIKQILLDGPTVVFHNGKFDLKFLDSYIGETLKPKKIADTMLLNYGLDERTGGGEKEDGKVAISTKLHSLKTIARVRYDVPNYTFDWEKFYAGEIDVQELFAYQARDCAYTLRLYHDLWDEAEPETRKLHDETLLLGSQALRQVEKRGICVDRANLANIREVFTAEYVRIKKEIDELALELTGMTDLNISSPKQVKELVAKLNINTAFLGGKVKSERTKWSGTDKNSLHKMALQYPEHHPVRNLLQNVMAYRVVKSTVGTNVEGLESRLDDDDRIRTSFLLHGTVTGRLSSRNPNLQNLPNYGSGGSGGSGFASAVQSVDVVKLSQSIRNSIIPTPGYTFVEADFSQLELRILAYYCDDENLKNIFINGEDIHTRVAAEIFGKPAEEISGEERRHGKVVDFGIVYGRSPGQIVGGPEMDIVVERGGERWTIDQAEGFLRRFFDGFPKVEPWLQASRRLAHTQHEVRSPLGRVRRLPLVLADGHAERQAINSPIQSLASDICLHSLAQLVDTIPEEKGYVLLTIHDSILCEIKDEYLDEMIPFIKATMEATKDRLLDTPIPMIVDVKTGKRWGEMQKL